MITLDELVAKYDGKFCEKGGSAGAINQCVDLANAKIEEVDGQPIILGTNAVDFPSKIDRTKYDWTDNATDNFPPRGAVIVYKQYGSRYGSAGHIAVVLSADVNSATVFEQNYPTGSVCTTHTRNYLGCLGWFTLKDIYYKGIDTTNTASVKVAIDAWKDLVDGKLKTLAEYQILQDQFDTLKKSVNDLDKRLTELEGTIATKDEKIAFVTEENRVLTEENQTLTNKVANLAPYKGWYEEALKTQVNKYTASELFSFAWKKFWADRKAKANT